jgi:hypothetical protein
MTTATKIMCQPLRQLHVVDRRDFVKDERGNYILVNGQKQLNWRCACGQTSTHSADYRGGNFAYVLSDEEATPYEE